MKNLVIYGTGDFAFQAYEYFSLKKKHNLIGFTSDSSYNPPKTFMDLTVFPYKEIGQIFSNKNTEFFVALGYSNLNMEREKRFLEIKSLGFKLASFIHTSNHIPNDFSIGENCIIMEGNIFQNHVRINDNSIICVGNRIGHDVLIHKNIYLTSGITIGGKTEIGKNCFIGFNSSIRNGVKIGNYNLIGMNCIINKSTLDYSTYIEEETNLAKFASNYYAKFI